MDQFANKSVAFLKKLFWRRKPNYGLPIVFQRQTLPKDPFSRFLKQVLATTFVLFLITSFAPSGLLETGFSAGVLWEEDGTDDLAQDPYGLFLQDDFYLLKENVNGDTDVSRLGVTDMVTHTVETGETLSQIAARYGLMTETLLWENRLFDGDRLKLGQTLIIPPLDGVSVTVSQGQTLASIAKLYNVTPEIIREHNKLSGDTLQKGRRLFLPGAKPLTPPQPIYARNGDRGIRVAKNTFDIRPPTVVTKANTNGKLIYPTNGQVSRGFVGGHYALDIANRAKPDVWAAKGGKVITAKGGCPVREEGRYLSCGSGYGNHIVIDHGDGLQTVYAHLETLYVEEGTQVETGQLIGKMGNTGRSYGATGIHLHFEVIDNGVKRNPARYF